MIEKDGRIDETPKNKIPGDKVTIEQIKKAFQSFDDVYDSICNASKSGNEKKAFELADEYIRNFEPIYNLIQKYNIKYDSEENNNDTKYDFQKIIFNNLYGRFKIFQIRMCLLRDCDNIPKEEKIQQLDDMYNKVTLWIKYYAPNKEMLGKLSYRYSMKKEEIKKQNFQKHIE